MLPVLLWELACALHTDPDGAALAARIREGDREAFRTFFDRHHARLVGYVRSRGVPQGAAEDIVQEAFLYIWTHREAIDPEQSLRAYLFRIGYTRALNHRRDRTREELTDDPSSLDGATAQRPDRALADQERTEQIEAAIAQLSERRRSVIELCMLEELTYREAAQVLGITRKTVENHMGHALKDLRERLRLAEDGSAGSGP